MVSINPFVASTFCIHCKRKIDSSNKKQECNECFKALTEYKPPVLDHIIVRCPNQPTRKYPASQIKIREHKMFGWIKYFVKEGNKLIHIQNHLVEPIYT